MATHDPDDIFYVVVSSHDTEEYELPFGVCQRCGDIVEVQNGVPVTATDARISAVCNADDRDVLYKVAARIRSMIHKALAMMN
jgi:hypothetical protein